MNEPTLITLRLTPDMAGDPEQIRAAAARELRCRPAAIREVVVVRRSLDARYREPKLVLQVEVYRRSLPRPPVPAIMSGVPALKGPKVVVIGAGPAGYFAALELLLLGLQPVILERGRDSRARRYDLRTVMQDQQVPEDSNYCYGEGGAGTYSDGKLYTRSDKRGDVSKVLRLLVEHGARPDILVDAHPHIGSNKLPGVVENLRASLLHHGAEIHFETRVEELICQSGRVRAVRAADGREFVTPAVILATGHSARDVYRMLHRAGIALEAKSFALGLRIEHPQPLIDRIQYHTEQRPAELPAASYRLSCQVAGTGVYSFCMCPGGLIVPASTAPGEIVVNGMSMSGRNSRWANSGIVAEVREADLLPFAAAGPLAGLEFQASLERAAWNGENLRAPALRLTDFLADRISPDLPPCSYVPGLYPAPLGTILPDRIASCLKQALQRFGQMAPGYVTAEAVVVGIESRTSSPVRIPRERAGLFHPQLENLYPCGEGAGFAGGIVSAALDGQLVAQAVAATLANLRK